jgi:hypothetical protein
MGSSVEEDALGFGYAIGKADGIALPGTAAYFAPSDVLHLICGRHKHPETYF